MMTTTTTAAANDLVTINFLAAGSKSKKPWASFDITQRDLKMLKAICRRDHISLVRLFERMIMRHLRRQGAGSALAMLRQSCATRKAVMHLQAMVARRFGQKVSTDSGGARISITHDGVSLTNPDCRIVAEDSTSIARQLMAA